MPKKFTQDEIKKMLYRCWHRGCKETDILLGDYAQEKIFTLNDSQLLQLDNLLKVDDVHIYNWITEKIDTPEEYNNEILEDIKQFHRTKNA